MDTVALAVFAATYLGMAVGRVPATGIPISAASMAAAAAWLTLSGKMVL